MIVIVPVVVLIASVYMVKSGYCCWTTYKDAKSAAWSEIIVEHANQVEAPIGHSRQAQRASETTSVLPQSLDPLKLPQPASSRGYITLAEAMNVNSATSKQPLEPSSSFTEMNQPSFVTSRITVSTGYVSLSEILGKRDYEV